MVEQFRVLAALERALGSIYRTHRLLQSSITPVPGELVLDVFVPVGTNHLCGYTDIHAGKTLPHPQHTADQAGYGDRHLQSWHLRG